MDPDKLPEESKFLLELDFDTLYNSSFERQSYWVRAMKRGTTGRQEGSQAALSLRSHWPSEEALARTLPHDKDGRTRSADLQGSDTAAAFG